MSHIIRIVFVNRSFTHYIMCDMSDNKYVQSAYISDAVATRWSSIINTKRCCRKYISTTAILTNNNIPTSTSYIFYKFVNQVRNNRRTTKN